MTDWTTVYPRVCGGTRYWPYRILPIAGLSPRVRGNRRRAIQIADIRRSIPACAGEPRVCTAAPYAAAVYPRVCGGTGVQHRRGVRTAGLSPRVRGNHRNDLPPGPFCRSIPACAGEPGRAGVRSPPNSGLSPRVRGNLGYGFKGKGAGGSIPACAGEPRAGSLPGSAGGVYPRVCGGTILRIPSGAAGKGLSPRVRGNQMAVADTPG